MPATTFPEYVQRITDLLNHTVSTGEAVLNTLVDSLLEYYNLAMAQSYISVNMLT